MGRFTVGEYKGYGDRYRGGVRVGERHWHKCLSNHVFWCENKDCEKSEVGKGSVFCRPCFSNKFTEKYVAKF